MAELKSLDDLFKGKIFRIPDYQRGYAWQISHLRDFWEDLINLPHGRSHYTGVLTLKDVSSEISEEDNEYWLIEDRSYKMCKVNKLSPLISVRFNSIFVQHLTYT